MYVRAVPLAAGKWLISNQGGGMAAWRGDGKELFYESLDLKLMAVDITLSPKFQMGTPKPLFQTKVSAVLAGRNNFVVSRDGRRFLMSTPPDDAQADPVYVVVDWPGLLKRDTAGK